MQLALTVDAAGAGRQFAWMRRLQDSCSRLITASTSKQNNACKVTCW
jgi:hypothetical protein